MDLGMQGSFLKNKNLPHSPKSRIASAPLPYSHRSDNEFGTHPRDGQCRVACVFCK